ncbi:MULTISPECIES: segregation/condensation protein A [unclassified Coleofasciculus]|uniref:segregation/condensation protein A n=1 Tax=unclassified Coleofasciculus TaxID=2692782 RepID=UPI0018810D0A|nr:MULTISPECIES: ScpA family protein [unclassified Coleofasciculus]MBE9127276.1 segregation/condensation protein A [Coleofasciculus sp. LEGE 07081]MBE9150572.1 segregation/condensation protein A [Coleofasciculus sp. LEGE 07092]
MTNTPATDAIALLIDLAQRGEINPWDVQVIEVIDRYLSTLVLEPDAESGLGDTDLSQSGQAFLWASMLVLLKAETLERLEEPEEPESTDIEGEIDATGQSRLPLHLERHLRRRTAAPPPKRRPVTLQELIDQLQQIAEQLGESPSRSISKRSKALSRSQAAKAIAHLAHDENLTETAKRLELFISRHWHELAAGKDWLNLEQLLEWWTISTVTPTLVEGQTAVDTTKSPAQDRVGVFWALLLLSAQSKVELSQEEFYQDLKIRALE